MLRSSERREYYQQAKDCGRCTHAFGVVDTGADVMTITGGDAFKLVGAAANYTREPSNLPTAPHNYY